MSELNAREPHANSRLPELRSGEIQVWVLRQDEAPAPDRLRQRTREILAKLLCRHAGTAVAPRLALGPHGKPFAPGWPQLQFNLSHSGAFGLIALARGVPVGVDIEARRRRIDVGSLAQRFFSAGEAAALGALEEARRQETFLALWTRKEALLKALGSGLSFGLHQVEFGLDTQGRVGGLLELAAAAGAIGDWQVQNLDVEPGVPAALAWRGPARSVRVRRWRDPD